MGKAPFLLPKDLNGNTIPKFLDAYELVRFAVDADPAYSGYMHPDGGFVIAKQDGGTADGHITFHLGAVGETLTAKWADRASLTYVEYDALY
jgi:hypothetical protein